MIIGVPGNRIDEETRAAVTPPVAQELTDAGLRVLVREGIGIDAGWADSDYRETGCDILSSTTAVIDRSDILVFVRTLGTTPDPDPSLFAEDQTVIGMLGPYQLDAEYEALAAQGVSAFALELLPRISRAQSMDVLSSMGSLAGYKSAIVAAEALPKIFPMQMTAAGTVRPADVFVVGAGVAGLQAIATANRLGASVEAYDIRPEVKEEVESLGGTFLEIDLETDETSDDEGYAEEQEEAFLREQQLMMERTVANADVVITAASVPGKPSPELVTAEMIDGMDPGSVIIDLGAAGGGNCGPTEPGEWVTYNGVEIFGPTNLPATVPHHASQLYANNVQAFIEHLLETDELVIDTDDEIIDSTLLTHDGTARTPHLTEESA